MLHHHITEQFELSSKSYVVDFEKPMSVKDFLTTIEYKHPDEFGNIYIDDNPVVSREKGAITYKYGYLNSEQIVPGVKSVISWRHPMFKANVVAVTANAGWGRVDYYIQAEFEEEEQTCPTTE